jgi:hypothetical protein
MFETCSKITCFTVSSDFAHDFERKPHETISGKALKALGCTQVFYKFGKETAEYLKERGLNVEFKTYQGMGKPPSAQPVYLRQRGFSSGFQGHAAHFSWFRGSCNTLHCQHKV